MSSQSDIPVFLKKYRGIDPALCLPFITQWDGSTYDTAGRPARVDTKSFTGYSTNVYGEGTGAIKLKDRSLFYELAYDTRVAQCYGNLTFSEIAQIITSQGDLGLCVPPVDIHQTGTTGHWGIVNNTQYLSFPVISGGCAVDSTDAASFPSTSCAPFSGVGSWDYAYDYSFYNDQPFQLKYPYYEQETYGGYTCPTFCDYLKSFPPPNPYSDLDCSLEYLEGTGLSFSDVYITEGTGFFSPSRPTLNCGYNIMVGNFRYASGDTIVYFNPDTCFDSNGDPLDYTADELNSLVSGPGIFEVSNSSCGMKFLREKETGDIYVIIDFGLMSTGGYSDSYGYYYSGPFSHTFQTAVDAGYLSGLSVSPDQYSNPDVVETGTFHLVTQDGTEVGTIPLYGVEIVPPNDDPRAVCQSPSIWSSNSPTGDIYLQVISKWSDKDSENA